MVMKAVVVVVMIGVVTLPPCIFFSLSIRYPSTWIYENSGDDSGDGGSDDDRRLVVVVMRVVVIMIVKH